MPSFFAPPGFRRAPVPVAAGLLTLSFLLPTALHAQNPEAPQSDADAATPATVSTTAPVELAPITVQASPFRGSPDDLVRRVDVLQGAELDRKRRATLGELLEGEPGVATSDFGPGVGRPILRGQAGPRVLVLENGLSTMDAATISNDHAVTLDPAHAEQVEIIKGPATLIYGSAASAGVVNVNNSRLPDRLVPGFSGTLDGAYGSNADERSGRAELDYGLGNVQLHGDFARRRAKDLDIPESSQQLANSAVESESGAVSASLIGKDARIGAAASVFTTQYGLPQEEEAFILMRQSRADVDAVWKPRAVVPWLERLSARVGVSDYKHTEFEAPREAGTIFFNDEQEARFEAEHAVLPGGFRGVAGLQFGHREFEAQGEEAFVPRTDTRSVGVFVVEQKRFGWGTVEGGLRYENVRQNPTDAALVDRNREPLSVALGALYDLNADYHLRANFARSQRAPTAEELYAFGPHLATSTFERGDDALDPETVRNYELGIDKHRGRFTFSSSAYYESTTDYIYLDEVDCNLDAGADRAGCAPDGEADVVTAEGTFVGNDDGGDDGVTDGEEGTLQLVDYRRGPARFYGVEGEAVYRLLTGPQRLQVRVFGDFVRGKLRDGGDNLPRITPPRVGLSFGGGVGNFNANLTWTRVQRQDEVASLESETPGYNLVNADLSYKLVQGPTAATVFVRGRNLLDEETRRHTSFLKDVYPGVGRGVYAGVTLRWR